MWLASKGALVNGEFAYELVSSGGGNAANDSPLGAYCSREKEGWHMGERRERAGGKTKERPF